MARDNAERNLTSEEAMLSDLPEGAAGPSRRTHLVLGAVVLGLAIAVFVVARGYGLGELQRPGPGAFPGVIAVGIGVMGLLLLLQGLMQRRGAEAPLMTAGGRRVAVMGLLLVLYVIALYAIGFTVSSVLAAVAMAHVLEARLSWAGKIIYALALVLAIEVLMTSVFSIRFPGGLVGMVL